MHISSRSKVNILLSLLVISSACLALLVSAKSSAQAAGSHLSLSPNYGHPSASIKVAGKRFGTSETISIMFDATSVGTATTSSTGAFSTSIIIPSLALPGTHTIRATGTTSGLTASASFLVRTDWTLFGFDANHTNVNPYENVLSPTNVSHLTLDWSMTTGGAIVSEPAVVKDVVYIGSADHNFYALNANTGAVLWTATTGGGIVWSSPAVANGIVYVGSGDDKLYAFNANTGAIVWTASTGGSIESSPTVAKGIVYVGSSDNKLYAFNALTGATVWVASIGNISSPYSPVVASSLVLLGLIRK